MIGCRLLRNAAHTAPLPRWSAAFACNFWMDLTPGQASYHAPNTRVWVALGGLGAGLALFGCKPANCEAKESRLYPKDLEDLVKPTEANPTPVLVPPPFPGLARQQWSQKHVAPVLGLPMRGKSHTARQLKRYIQFFHGARAEIFDVNDYLGPGGDQKLYEDLEVFFGGASDAYEINQRSADLARGGFAIILSGDTVESTRSMWSAHTKLNRKLMARKLTDDLGAEVCFIQISVDGLKNQQYVADLAAHRGMTLAETQEIISAYQDHYVPIQMDGSENDTAFVHLINYRQTMIVHKMMRYYVGSEVCHFLSNLHPYQHTIYLSRHGESEFNVEQRLGGDSGLSARGTEYARRLAEFTKFVICGHAKDLVCVTLLASELEKLRLRLEELSSRGVVAHGDWSNFGDSSGAKVLPGMRLIRLQLGYGADFVDAPQNLEDLVEVLQGAHLVTLAFILGETKEAGQVPGRLWTSSLRRTIDTAQFVEHNELADGPDGRAWKQMRGVQFRNLDEVYAGEYDGLTEADIAKRAPDVIAARKRDKLGFRYPRGECYYDLIARLESVLSHLERVTEPTLLISHQAILRLIYGWLTEVPREDCLDLRVPQHEVIKISFDGLGPSGRASGPVMCRIETQHPLGPTKLVDDGQSSL
eukprot:TRINITY_DN6485_c0_g1_i2.p1 TRINITY_DN6485_c0_g1~~TRINITY_DN6485_c0_g1_i2.p1  ORF type:complete len:644 (-),score=83.16 TRINITY_DN6485_c0_g1_i2:127-2058(-)